MTGAAKGQEQLTPRCVSIDLEIGIRDLRIHRFAAVRGDTGQSMTYEKGDLGKALARLDDFADGAAFLLGHNLVAFDAPHLEAARPDMRLLRLPRVDTLRLNPLAFPRNPYHHLVKHYQDGQLKRGRLNDPGLDARLTLEVFGDQKRAFRDAPPELLSAWHWLATRDGTGSGVDSFFTTVRSKARPSDQEARAAIEQRLRGQACLTHGVKAVEGAEQSGWPLAYALAWLSVAGGNSVMPPWVRHQFPEAGALLRRLRGALPLEVGACLPTRLPQREAPARECHLPSRAARGAFFGHADFLRRVAGNSALGAWRYEVLDTKLALKWRKGCGDQATTPRMSATTAGYDRPASNAAFARRARLGCSTPSVGVWP
jgi:hypothetical protein